MELSEILNELGEERALYFNAVAPPILQNSNFAFRTVLAWLKAHPKVDRVLYPLDPGFPQYELARKQMSGAGGLFTFTLKDGTPARITLALI